MHFLCKKNVTHVYEEPSKLSPIIFTKDWVFPIYIEKFKLQTFPNGWLSVEGELAPIDKPRKKYKGWIALDTVVSEKQLNLVKSCWPISYIEYEAGEFYLEIKAGLDGNFVTHSGEKGHIYYHDSIVVFLTTKGIELEAGYNSSTRELTYWDNVTKQTLFPAEKLRGCGPEPTVE